MLGSSAAAQNGPDDDAGLQSAHGLPARWAVAPLLARGYGAAMSTTSNSDIPVAEDGRWQSGIPPTVLDSYRKSADTLGASGPGCHLEWQLLAAVGRVESNHARYGDVHPDGTARRPIFGPQLDGTRGMAAIAASSPAWDGWAQAAGPMQFLPSVWRRWAADGNGDGRVDPQNIYDASLAAGRYLCSAGSDLARPDGLRQAILSYNDSTDYLSLVQRWNSLYQLDGGAAPDTPETGAFSAHGTATDRGRPQIRHKDTTKRNTVPAETSPQPPRPPRSVSAPAGPGQPAPPGSLLPHTVDQIGDLVGRTSELVSRDELLTIPRQPTPRVLQPGL